MSDIVKVNIKWFSIIGVVFSLVAGVWFTSSRVSAAEICGKQAKDDVKELKEDIMKEVRYIRLRLDAIDSPCGK